VIVQTARTKPETGAGGTTTIWSCVAREHAMIRTLLDELERGGDAAVNRRRGGLEAFRRAVWDLFVAFDDHLSMEERDVLPILRASGARGEARALSMISEHNEQRRVVLELVEDTECDLKEIEALVSQAHALVAAFRTDMELEETALAAARA
jgi:hemerythrin-like domain-containing protein